MVKSKFFTILQQILSIGKQKAFASATKKFVGQDKFGNKYYELYRPNHQYRRYQRIFETEDKEIYDTSSIVDKAHVPPAWDSWLRFRKTNPPTPEELDESDNYFKFQQTMAAKRKLQEASKETKDENMLKSYKEKLPKHNREKPTRED